MSPKIGSLFGSITGPQAYSGTSALMGLGGALLSKPNSADLYRSSSPAFYAGQTLQQQAITDQTNYANAQADQAMKESHMAALQKAREIHDIREQQALDYSNSGIILEGSPMAVLERTRSLGQEEIEYIEDSGVAIASSIYRQNMIQTNQIRAGMISASANYNSGLAQAKIRDYQTKASGINTALGALNNMFGSTTSPMNALKQQNGVSGGILNDPNPYTPTNPGGSFGSGIGGAFGDTNDPMWDDFFFNNGLMGG